jgi:hypothetical protein
MVISERLNQHRLKEILINIYARGMETENVHVKDLIEEIIKQMLDDSISSGGKA